MGPSGWTLACIALNIHALDKFEYALKWQTSSCAETQLLAVIIELFGELVVVLPLERVKLLGGTLGREEGRNVFLLHVDLELVQSFALAPVHVVSRVNESLSFLQLLVHIVVRRSNISRHKGVLSRAVTEQQMRLSANLYVFQSSVVILVLFMVLHQILKTSVILTKMSCWLGFDF